MYGLLFIFIRHDSNFTKGLKGTWRIPGTCRCEGRQQEGRSEVSWISGEISEFQEWDWTGRDTKVCVTTVKESDESEGNGWDSREDWDWKLIYEITL